MNQAFDVAELAATYANKSAQGHTLTVALPPQPAQVLGDAKRLVQVFANLLNNAASTARKAR